MKRIEIYHLNGCPYCANARRAIAELTEEDPAYGGIELVWIEEREHPELAEKRDYFRVPTLFCGEEKLYEADPSQGFAEIRSSVRKAFDRVLGR